MLDIVIALLIFVIITLVVLSDGYLKAALLRYIAMTFSAIVGLTIAMNYFEQTADILVQKGTMANWAHGISYTLLFFVSFGIIFAIAQTIIRSDIKFAPAVEKIVSMASTLVFAVILTGVIVTSLGMLPIGKDFVPYRRYNGAADSDTKLVDADNNLAPKSMVGKADELTTALFKIVSSGSMSGKSNFSVSHKDFTDEIYLNRLRVEDGVSTVAGNKAIVINPKKKNTVLPAHTKMRYASEKNEYVEQISGYQLMVVSFDISKKKIKNGGATPDGGKLKFTMGQLKLICSNESGTEPTYDTVYPVGLVNDNKKLETKTLKDIVTPVSVEGKENSDAYPMKVAFYVPDEMTPIKLGFKKNVLVNLPVKKSEDSEETTTEETSSTNS